MLYRLFILMISSTRLFKVHSWFLTFQLPVFFTSWSTAGVCFVWTEWMNETVPDLPDAKLSEYFDECFKFIDDAIADGGTVLVHCFAGVSRRFLFFSFGFLHHWFEALFLIEVMIYRYELTVLILGSYVSLTRCLVRFCTLQCDCYSCVYDVQVQYELSRSTHTCPGKKTSDTSQLWLYTTTPGVWELSTRWYIMFQYFDSCPIILLRAFSVPSLWLLLLQILTENRIMQDDEMNFERAELDPPVATKHRRTNLTWNRFIARLHFSFFCLVLFHIYMDGIGIKLFSFSENECQVFDM